MVAPFSQVDNWPINRWLNFGQYTKPETQTNFLQLLSQRGDLGVTLSYFFAFFGISFLPSKSWNVRVCTPSCEGEDSQLIVLDRQLFFFNIPFRQVISDWLTLCSCSAWVSPHISSLIRTMMMYHSTPMFNSRWFVFTSAVFCCNWINKSETVDSSERSLSACGNEYKPNTRCCGMNGLSGD